MIGVVFDARAPIREGKGMGEKSLSFPSAWKLEFEDPREKVTYLQAPPVKIAFYLKLKPVFLTRIGFPFR